MEMNEETFKEKTVFTVISFSMVGNTNVSKLDTCFKFYEIPSFENPPFCLTTSYSIPFDEIC